MNKNTIYGGYILNILRAQELSGHCYILTDDLYALCHASHKGLSYDTFRKDKAEMIRRGFLRQEGQRVCITRTWNYETVTAGLLADILANNEMTPVSLPEKLCLNGRCLTAEQREAVAMALPQTHVVLVGDPDQLQSVGAGNVLKDLL